MAPPPWVAPPVAIEETAPQPLLTGGQELTPSVVVLCPSAVGPPGQTGPRGPAVSVHRIPVATLGAGAMTVPLSRAWLITAMLEVAGKGVTISFPY